MSVYSTFQQSITADKKYFALLVDIDSVTAGTFSHLEETAKQVPVDFWFAGGLLSTSKKIKETTTFFKTISDIPVVLFSHNVINIASCNADATMPLSLLSSRNAEYLIGRHVVGAATIVQSKQEIISCGQILIDGGYPEALSYLSNSEPIPVGNTAITVCTAMAAQMLGLKSVWLNSGGELAIPVSAEIIQEVANEIQVPLIVSGGIVCRRTAVTAARNGANIIAMEYCSRQAPLFIKHAADGVHQMNGGITGNLKIV